jgi:hypothetical protein
MLWVAVGCGLWVGWRWLGLFSLLGWWWTVGPAHAHPAFVVVGELVSLHVKHGLGARWLSQKAVVHLLESLQQTTS